MYWKNKYKYVPYGIITVILQVSYIADYNNYYDYRKDLVLPSFISKRV